MSNRIPKIVELLPKKNDCCSCGHCTCEVCAMELVAGRVTVEACPDTTTEVRRMLSQVLRMEQEALSALRGLTAADVEKALTALLMVPARAAGLLIVLMPFVAALWVLTAWIFIK